MHDDALERPAFRKLVEAGEIELVDGGDPALGGARDRSSLHADTHGHAPPKTVSRRGDR